MDTSTRSIIINYQNNRYHIAYKLRSSADSKGTIVFLPGVGCIKECFDAAFAAESLKNYGILTADFLGFGESDKPDEFAYTLEDHAAITKLLIQALHLDHLIVVGHSMGGVVGLLLAEELPIDNFISAEGALVSQDISGLTGITHSEEEFTTTGFDAFRHMLLATGRKDFTTWAHWLETADKKALFRALWSTADWANNPKLLRLFNKLPKKSYLYGAERSKEYLLPQLVHTTIYRLENCGHFMMLDDPGEFYKSIAKASAS